MDVEERRARLAVRHHLVPQARIDELPQLADDLVALHSTDPVTVYLSAMARMAHPSLSAVEQALYVERSLIRHHAMRRTLWIATPEVARQMHAAATHKLVAPERRRVAGLLEASGVDDPDAWLADARDQTLAFLRRHGPTTARQLGMQVSALRHPLIMAAGTKWESKVSAHTRVLILLGFEGEILRARPTGTWVNGAYRYAAADQWLPGGLGDHDGRSAAEQLTRRWLDAFGPALTEDLKWWMGWTVATTKRALADARAVEVDLGGRPGWLAEDDHGTPPVEPWIALLPGLDPTTMGWKHRDWYLPDSAADSFDSSGNAGPTIWVDGRVVGAWAQTPDGRLHVHYFEKIGVRRRREVEDRAADLQSWVGETRFTIRFPGKIHQRLLG